jgi:hypothetical protein
METEEQTDVIVVVAVVGAVSFVLLTILIGIGAYCRFRRRRTLLAKKQPDIETADQVESPQVDPKKSESDEKESVGSGSTKTPDNVPSEEGGNSAGDEADVGSQQSPADTPQHA